MLYPISQPSYPSPNGRFDIASGCLVVIPIHVPAGGQAQLTMSQLIVDPQNYPQDRSMRCWISTRPGAGSFDHNPYLTWHLSALMHHKVIVHDADTPTPEANVAVPVAPGDYWLSVLNLVNESNSFSLVIG